MNTKTIHIHTHVPITQNTSPEKNTDCIHTHTHYVPAGAYGLLYVQIFPHKSMHNYAHV